MANDNTAIIIIGMVLIVALVMYGPVSMGFSNFISDAWDQWGQLFGDVTGGQGACSISMHIEYADGTTDDYSVHEQTLFPLSVYLGDNPKPILAVDFQVWGSFTYDGTLQSINQDTYIEFWFGTDMRKTGGATGPITYLPTSGASFKLAEMQVTDDNIESWAGADGTYACKILAVSTLTIQFSDGTTQELATSGPVRADFSFIVDADMGTTSLLSVSINADPWYDVTK